MPIEVAALVRGLIPISWSASPRVRVMVSPGRASEPTARIQTTSSPPGSTPSAVCSLTSAMSAGRTDESGTTSPTTASTTARAVTRSSARVRVRVVIS